MPRVYSKTKSTRGKTYRCESCGQDIVAGESYYEWSRRFGRSGQTYRQHSTCGRPRPTQLSSRKTAVLEEAVSELDFSTFAPEFSADDLDTDGGQLDIDVTELESLLEGIADIAREIGQEYQDGFDNMPEGLQQGPTAQAMEEVAQELESWADDLVSQADLDGQFDYEGFEYDEEAEASEEEQKAAWVEEVQAAFETKVSELAEAAESVTGDYPEYQG